MSRDDIEAVVRVLESDWLTTGPEVERFERALTAVAGSRHATAVSSGTAGLHAAMYALGVGPGDEVIVPTLTFAASANCVVYQGAVPVFADVSADTLLIDTTDVARKITHRTKAIVAVDYAGQPCDYEELQELASRYRLRLVADACHALGASYHGRPAGCVADLSVFSFHPVKHVTSGEGGAITTDDPALARRMKLFRNHGITTEARERESAAAWFYEMADIGYNYRLSDIACALASSQLKRLPEWVQRRREVAGAYDRAFADSPLVHPLVSKADRGHAYHLYVVQLDARLDRNRVFMALRDRGIGVNVHYVPVHLHPYYRRVFKTAPGMCPVAEQASNHILSLPMFPRMTDADVSRTVDAVREAVETGG